MYGSIMEIRVVTTSYGETAHLTKWSEFDRPSSNPGMLNVGSELKNSDIKGWLAEVANRAQEHQASSDSLVFLGTIRECSIILRDTMSITDTAGAIQVPSDRLWSLCTVSVPGDRIVLRHLTPSLLNLPLLRF